jgi:fermentation-respiration switch protein FrsA (DUF1100 family)
MVYRILTFVILSVFILLQSCEMDSFLFNPKEITEYTLSEAVIPPTAREEVILDSEGNKIYGFFISSNGIYKDFTVLYFHGNKHNINEYWDRVELLYKLGIPSFIIDYRGFGKSEGESSEESLYADARAARNYLINKVGIDTSKIIYYGYSLGSVPAVNLAVEHSPYRLILEAPFASGETLVQSGTIINIPGSYVLRGKFDNAEKIKNVFSPVTIFHGENDKFIDINKNGAVIFNNANEPKQFIRVPGADHDNIPETLGEEQYLEYLKSIIQ